MREFINCTPRLFNNLFDFGSELESFMGRGVVEKEKSWSPAADITEDEVRYYIAAELPGVNQKEVKVTVENKVLTVKGERKYENKSEDNHVHRIERSYGTFSRSFRLPQEVDADGINASYKDGILEISIPKTEKAKPKQIDIQIH